MNTITALATPGTNNDQLSHAPDDILWINPQRYVESTWDGTPIDVTTSTRSEICTFIRPAAPFVVRGLREHFYNINPFADNVNPTVAEINNWNLEVIRHFRALLGNTTPVNNNARLYLEARWSDERKYTEAWDSQYPGAGDPGKADGVCFIGGNPVDTSGGHCGEAFFPNTADRATAIAQPPYSNDTTTYPELTGYVERHGRAAGLSGAKASFPWSIKFAWLLANWICDEGLTGHPGPYVGDDAREQFGCSWWREDPAADWVNFRGKWR